MVFEIVKSNKKVELVQDLISELDELYDDLTYPDFDEKKLNVLSLKLKSGGNVKTVRFFVITPNVYK